MQAIYVSIVIMSLWMFDQVNYPTTVIVHLPGLHTFLALCGSKLELSFQQKSKGKLTEEDIEEYAQYRLVLKTVEGLLYLAFFRALWF